MAQQKTVGIVGGTLIAGAMTFVAVVPAQALESEPSPATTQAEASTATTDANIVPTETSTASTEVNTAPTSASAAKAQASTAKPAKRSTPAKRSNAEITIAMVKSGKAELQRGDKGKAVATVQDKLTKVGIITPVTGDFDKTTAFNVARFNEKFRGFSFNENQVVTKYSWLKLRKESKTKIPRACRTKKAALCVSKQQKVVRYYKNGRLVTALDARFGAEGYRTREGNFKIFRKVKNDYSTLYKTPMPWSMYFSGGQAIHYSFFFPRDGYNGASHGCVNIRDKRGIIKLWKQVKIGTFTKVY
jgi:hypothetical protein